MPQRFFVWTEEMSVGVKLLDDDHKILVGLINDLHEGIVAGRGTERLGRVVEGLVQYTRSHFEHEEDFFAQTNFPTASEHMREHQVLNEMVANILARYNKGQFEALSLDTMDFLRNWLFEHVLSSDKDYTAHLNAAGIH